MSNATTRRPSLNIPLIVLWVVSLGIGLFGLFFLLTGNTAQADFYNTGGSDYLQYLSLQTQSTIGGMLLTAGVVGVFIALATHARNWSAAKVAADRLAHEELYARELDEEDGDDGFDATGLRDEDTVATTPTVRATDATDAPATRAAAADAPGLAEPDTAVPQADRPTDATDRP